MAHDGTAFPHFRPGEETANPHTWRPVKKRRPVKSGGCRGGEGTNVAAP
jgi:hypothetical protein|eukprot:COSAG01_NODE_10895_length_2058_cov_1.534456_2_plen_49_part_00